MGRHRQRSSTELRSSAGRVGGATGSDGKRLDEIFLQAAALDSSARDRYLDEATGEDRELLAEVRERLRSARKLDSSFLAEPAARLFDGSTENLAGEGEVESHAPASRFPAGTLIDQRYRIIDCLGRGGMGEVYRADDLKLDETVALKFLPPALERDPARRARLLAEARIARKITHPNFCRVHDVGETDGLAYLSMEYVDGEDLASLLRRIGRLPEVKAREIGLEICSGLAAVHRLGILHRDLKPANVMLDGTGRIRIADFGLAGNEGMPEPSGSPAYLAPERWDGHPVTVRSELYALGLLLYELFTGHPAFPIRASIDWRRLHREDQPIPPSRRMEGFDPALEKLILRCLEKDPGKRPASAEEVAEVLAATIPGKASRSDVSLKTLVACGLGTAAGGLDHKALHDRCEGIIRRLCESHNGCRIDTPEGRLSLFQRPAQALGFALDYHTALEKLAGDTGLALQGRVAIHLDEPAADEADRGAGWAQATVRRLLSLSSTGQTLLTAGAFNLARRGSADEKGRKDLNWLAHGAYLVEGMHEPLEVFEVGVEGQAPMSAPEDTEEARRVVDLRIVLGWRPAPGVKIPGRPHWVVREKIGEGGFGDVWLASHRKTGERRVLKFCYEAHSLRSLQREITLFRLLKEELGERDDITRILDWNFEQAPYYIESEYTPEGDLHEWAKRRGGLEQIPLETRFEVLAQVAEALAAAHSVGVLHKDVKPSNVLISELPGGAVRARLTDFGIGLLVDRELLADADFTVLGMTETTPWGSSSREAGTRLYLAPELMEGRPATVQADIYSLGVFLYQVAVGDLSRALAPGWRREVDNELLRQDIAEAVDGVPERRMRDARLLAERLRALDERQSTLDIERQRARELEQAGRRRRLLAVVFAILLLVTGAAIFTGREARRANREADAARLVSQFMTDLFEVSFPSEARGNSVTAREILDRGAEKIKFDLGEEPITRARLMATIGSVYVKLGLYDQAEPLLDEALKVQNELLGSSHSDVATTLAAKAEVAALTMRYGYSESLFRNVLEIQRDSYGSDHPVVVETLGELATVYFRQGRHSEANALFQQTLEMTEKALGTEDPSLVRLLDNLARNLLEQGRYAEAAPHFLRALAIGEGALGTDHPDVAATLTNLGDLHREQNLFAEAEEYYRRSLETKERIYGLNHPELISTLNNWGQVFSGQGRYEEAEALHLRAQDISVKANDSRVGYALYHLGEIRRKQGNYGEAEVLFQQVHVLTDKYLPPGHRLSTYPLLGLANVYRDLGRYAEAEPLYRRALEIRQKLLPSGHFRRLEVEADYAAFLEASEREDSEAPAQLSDVEG